VPFNSQLPDFFLWQAVAPLRRCIMAGYTPFFLRNLALAKRENAQNWRASIRSLSAITGVVAAWSLPACGARLRHPLASAGGTNLRR
jgi:hypothetical protein